MTECRGGELSLRPLPLSSPAQRTIEVQIQVKNNDTVSN